MTGEQLGFLIQIRNWRHACFGGISSPGPRIRIVNDFNLHGVLLADLDQRVRQLDLLKQGLNTNLLFRYCATNELG